MISTIHPAISCQRISSANAALNEPDILHAEGDENKSALVAIRSGIRSGSCISAIFFVIIEHPGMTAPAPEQHPHMIKLQRSEL